nr:class C sortase [Corynebacterium sp. TAE3-ERU12]
MLPVVLVLLGLLILLYPVVATQWNNAQQLRAAQEYSKLEQNTDPAVLSQEWESAHRYNAERGTGPILDPWLARISSDNVEYQAYLKELAVHEVMGRIIVPAAQVDLPIYHGTGEDTLQRGVGHLYGSELPVGGENTHSVLTGHTGLTNATLFDNLGDVKKGDPFYLAVAGEKLKYEVHDIRVVLPEETDSLKPVAGEDLVTLVTCTPYGINTHRLLVTGHRVPLDPEDASAFEDSGLHWQWWMWVIVAVAVLILLMLALWIRKVMRRNNENSADYVDNSTTPGQEQF